MTLVDWFGVALAVVLLIPLPFLEAHYRRERARDAARWEEHKRRIREHFAAELADAQRSKQAPTGED